MDTIQRRELAATLEPFRNMGPPPGSELAHNGNGVVTEVEHAPIDGPASFEERLRRLEAGLEASVAVLNQLLESNAFPRSPRRQGMLTSTEAASYLGIGLATVRRWADKGDLPVSRTPGGQRRFKVEDLAEIVKPQT